MLCVFFCKQKTAYEMRISDWSSDVCSSDLSIREVASATEHVNEVALRVVSASNSSMVNSDEQASRTNSVAAAINQLGAAAQEIARNAAQASHQASDARGLAEDGQQVVNRKSTRLNSSH